MPKPKLTREALREAAHAAAETAVADILSDFPDAAALGFDCYDLTEQSDGTILVEVGPDIKFRVDCFGEVAW